MHAEVPGDVRAMLAKIRAAGIKAGVSIKPGTGVDTIKEMLPLCDLVLVMTVEPGFGGQKFMADMMPKIAALRELGYRGQIMVDGGINADTAAQAVAAGDGHGAAAGGGSCGGGARLPRAGGQDVKQQYGKRASNRGKPGEFQHKHSLGQNFLTDTALLESLVDETGVGAQDAILEVGPGAGDMTRILAARCRHVTSVEIDRVSICLKSWRNTPPIMWWPTFRIT